MNTIDHWDPVVDEKIDNYFPQRHTFFLNQLEAEDLYPSTEAPEFAQHGGIVPAGYRLTITAGAGASIRYTLDGADPMDNGTIIYSSAVPLSGQVTVRARAREGAEWSALTEATFLVGAMPASASNLVMSELNYRPASASPAEALAGFTDRDAFEFIELMNVGSLPVDLTGVRFTDGVTFGFAPSSFLLAGESLVLARDAAGFELRYGFAPFAEYAGGLSNDGERIVLVDEADGVIVDMTYNDKLPWPESADGEGFTLVLLDGDPAEAGNWRPSAAVGGTPAGSDGVAFGGGSPDELLAYALGSGEISPKIEAGFLVIEVPVNPTAQDVNYRVEVSTDLSAWSGDVSDVIYLGESAGVRRYRSVDPVDAGKRIFARLNVDS